MSQFIHDYVAAKKAAWLATNNPTGHAHPHTGQPQPAPSAQHIATWTDMAVEQYAKDNAERVPAVTPELTDAEHIAVEERLAQLPTIPQARSTKAATMPPPRRDDAPKESGK